MKKDDKIKILHEVMRYSDVRAVVEVIGEERFIQISSAIVNFAPPMELVDPNIAELLDEKYHTLCRVAWYDLYLFKIWPSPSKAQLGYALIVSACLLFEQALEENALNKRLERRRYGSKWFQTPACAGANLLGRHRPKTGCRAYGREVV